MLAALSRTGMQMDIDFPSHAAKILMNSRERAKKECERKEVVESWSFCGMICFFCGLH